MRCIFYFIATFCSCLVFASNKQLQNFLFIGGNDPKSIESKITDQINGVQIVYSWKDFEQEKDVYNFKRIEQDFSFLNARKKKLWLQLQDRFFYIDDKSIPEYLQNESIYQGGLASQNDKPGEGKKIEHGWVTKQWNPNVRKRYQKLIKEIAKRFDGRIYGINLPETAADINIEKESKSGFSCDKYYEGTMENINFAREVFKKSFVVQYTNFWPCEWENDHNYMRRLFQNASKRSIGLGGPDIIPFRKGQMENSYPFFNEYRGKLQIVTFAVQEPTRTYTNPKTGKKFTDEEFIDFGKNFLGADIIFWSIN